MARDYVCLYHSYLDAIQALGDAERGRLLTAMLEYSITGAAPQLGGNERYIFPMVKAQIERRAVLEDVHQKPEKLRLFLKAQKAKEKAKEKEKAKAKKRLLTQLTRARRRWVLCCRIIRIASLQRRRAQWRSCSLPTPTSWGRTW